MDPTACLHPVKGRGETVSWQAIPYHKGSQGYSHEGDRPTGIVRGDEVATILAMGLTVESNYVAR